MDEPQCRLAPAAKKVWRLTAGLSALAALAVASVLGTSLASAGADRLLALAPFVLAAVGGVIAVVVVPELRYRRWRYEIRDDEIDIRHGAVAIRRTLIPMTRVQHVDTRSGPLQSSFDLATVAFHTAAGENAIPQLTVGEADEVRRRVAAFARIGGDDEV